MVASAALLASVESEDSAVPVVELVAVLVVALEAALEAALVGVLFLSLEIVENACMHACMQGFFWITLVVVFVQEIMLFMCVFISQQFSVSGVGKVKKSSVSCNVSFHLSFV